MEKSQLTRCSADIVVAVSENVRSIRLQMVFMDIKFISVDAGEKISRGKSLSKIFASKEEALNVIEKAILFFRDNGLKGERFAETIERIGFENVEKALLQD